jgi:predicted phosphodiesterase
VKYAVCADVHGNHEALRAVLADIKKRRISDVLFAGDAVGYGPDPDACVHLLEAECAVLIAGNHDWAVLGLTDLDHFNPYARAAVEWTMRAARQDTLAVLGRMRLSLDLRDRNAFLVHGTPHEPERWHYLFSLWDAEESFLHFDRQICFVGHSHQPFIIERLPSGEMLWHKGGITMGKTERYIVNVGSVGQPRDGDPRACYAVVDGDEITLHRVAYPVQNTQAKMRAHGLPLPLIERLARGT